MKTIIQIIRNILQTTNLVFLLLITCYLMLIFYTFRGIYLKPFDASYWKNKFEQSQWSLPLSNRTIGDDGLYLYEGYRLIHGGDPSLINVEMPPLGKYLIGLSIMVFHNGNMYGFLTMTAVLIVFYLITRKLFNPPISFIITALFALDPLVINQFPLTMLDSLQLFFLLLTLILLISLHKPVINKNFHIILLSISLAGFALSKAPLFTPLLGIIVFYCLWTTWKSIKTLIILFFSTSIFYCLAYIRYFFLHHSFLDFIKIQKWIISFYIHGGIHGKFMALFSTLLLNRYPDLFKNSFSTLSEWSPLWPIITIAGILILFQMYKDWRNTIRNPYFSLYVWALLIIIVLSFIPLWPRYLLIVLPFLYLFFGVLISKINNNKILIGICSVLLITQIFSLLPITFPVPDGMIKQFSYTWENGLFQDMYEELSEKSQQQMSRDEFFKFGKTLWHNGEIEQAYVKYGEIPWNRFSTSITIPMSISYITENLGSFDQATNLPIVKEHNRWKVHFSWNMYIKNISPNTHLETTIIPGKRGSIVNWIHTPISYDFESTLISIKPDEVDKTKEDEMNSFIEELFNTKIQSLAIHHRYVFNTIPSMIIPIGVIPHPMTEKQKESLLSFPGIKLSKSTARMEQALVGFDIGITRQKYYYECCSYLYSPTNYEGISGLEKEKNDILQGQNGGTLNLIDTSTGQVIQTLIEKKPIHGNDVILEKPPGIE
jgi:hypothetical protein